MCEVAAGGRVGLTAAVARRAISIAISHLRKYALYLGGERAVCFDWLMDQRNE